VMAEIVERTDGIPLFVEEMRKAVPGQRGRGPAHRCGGSISDRGGPCKFACLVNGAARP
jgi:hypothetical protein